MDLDKKIFSHPDKKSIRKNKTINDAKFRRQHSIGNYVLDFYCPGHFLAIEVDGDSHFNSKQSGYDLSRQKYIESFGIKVLRFTNHDIYYNLENVLETISSYIKPPPTPPLRGGE